MTMLWSRLAGTACVPQSFMWLLLIVFSHVFCIDCANRLQLSNPPACQRPVCPACDAHLINPDDAVITNLNPTEDYKTSVLSGLSPNIIMECAGRALSFWAYQITQEVYVGWLLKMRQTDAVGTESIRNS